MNRKNRILAAAMALLILVAAVFAIGCGKQEGNDKPPKTPSPSITLDKETMSLDADASDQLTASGADEVVWTSENPAVATVDANGKVTGINAGTCKVTASTKDGKYQAECTVTVTGYHLSDKVVSGIKKIENNTYNGEINYTIDNSDENALLIRYDRQKMTNKCTTAT